jgi:putative hydrolase of the HAD superfamily
MALLVWYFDNTLACRKGMWTQSLMNILSRKGDYSFYEASIREHLNTGFPWHRHEEAHADYFEGKSWWDYMNQVLGRALTEAGLSIELIEACLHGIREEYIKASEWRVYDDTMVTLEKAIQLGHRNIVLSNHVPELETLIDSLGLSQFFERIYTSAIVGYEKPHPKMFSVVETHKQGNEKVIMIGDSYVADVQGALNCGWQAIKVRSENKNNYPCYSENLKGIWTYF